MFSKEGIIITNLVSIDKIQQIFSHNQRYYILFSLVGISHEYLYMVHKFEPIYALFFGNSFSLFLEKFDLTKNACFECELGTRILGGISFDQGEQVEFNLNRDFANQILIHLKEKVLKEYHQYFKLFK
ncbi:hypothetical protein [Candidatus Harpocratesius sp.]